MTILILGIGNPIMSDDAIGVRAVEMLRHYYRLPAQVSLVEGGTLGLALLPQVEDAERLLLVDAVDTGAAPGTLIRLTGAEIPLALQTRISPHQMGLDDLLTVAALLGTGPKETVLWGIQPESLEMSLQLSATVEAQLEALVEKLLQELAHWGVAAERMAVGECRPEVGAGAG